MSYTPTTWVDGSTPAINATNLNHIETGISQAHGLVGLPLGLTGATQPTRYVGATTSGAPASGTFQTGDFVVTNAGNVWVCTTGGSPGTWQAVGLQPWTSYTPTIGNDWTIGNGTVDFEYQLNGPDTMFIRGMFTIGSTTGTTTNALRISIPSGFTATTDFYHVGCATMSDDSATNRVDGFAEIPPGEPTKMRIRVSGTGGNALDSTNPFTWATNDDVTVSIMLKVQ